MDVITDLYALDLADGLPVTQGGQELRYKRVRLRETTVADERAAQQTAERVVKVDGQHKLLVSEADFRYALTMRHIDWLECDGVKLYGASLDLGALGGLSSNDLALIEGRIFLMSLAAEVRYGNMTQEQFEAVLGGKDEQFGRRAPPQFDGQTTGLGAAFAEPESGPSVLATFAGGTAKGAPCRDSA